VTSSVKLVFSEVQIVGRLDSSNQMLHGLLGHVLRDICLVQNFLQGVAMELRTQDKRHERYLSRGFLQLFYHAVLARAQKSLASSSLIGLFTFISLAVSITSLPLALYFFSNSSGVKHLPL